MRFHASPPLITSTRVIFMSYSSWEVYPRPHSTIPIRVIPADAGACGEEPGVWAGNEFRLAATIIEAAKRQKSCLRFNESLPKFKLRVCVSKPVHPKKQIFPASYSYSPGELENHRAGDSIRASPPLIHRGTCRIANSPGYGTSVGLSRSWRRCEDKTSKCNQGCT